MPTLATKPPPLLKSPPGKARGVRSASRAFCLRLQLAFHLDQAQTKQLHSSALRIPEKTEAKHHGFVVCIFLHWPGPKRKVAKIIIYEQGAWTMDMLSQNCPVQLEDQVKVAPK